MQRSVFFISDGTGITAETLGYSLISQFEQISFKTITLPFVDTIEKAEQAVSQINSAYVQDQACPLIFSTLINAQIRHIIATSKGLFLDFFAAFIEPIELELNIQSSHTIGRSHSVHNNKNYEARIDAINFTVQTDDGVNFHQYQQADLILVGVSRCGKTPTSLYLALQYGIRVANYPLTEDDLNSDELPTPIKIYQSKLYGLTIDPQRLHTIRSERRPHSHYASMTQCQREVHYANELLEKAKIPIINTTTLSIEEISTKILSTLGIRRKVN